MSEDDEICELPPHLIPNRMSVEEYDRQHAELDAIYGKDRREAPIRREQEFARFFRRSNWTQEELAAKEGVHVTVMHRWTLFGRFLDFEPMGSKPEIPTKSLTERRFRTFWQQTDAIGNEYKRFQRVIDLMLAETTLEKANTGDLARKIIDEYGDGEWHLLASVVDFLGEDEKICAAALDKITKNKTLQCKVEKKPYGASFKFVIYRLHDAISVNELVAKLGPIIKLLQEEGKKGPARIQGAQISNLAGSLQNLLDEWSQ